jgi:hypothetical protein
MSVIILVYFSQTCVLFFVLKNFVYIALGIISYQRVFHVHAVVIVVFTLKGKQFHVLFSSRCFLAFFPRAFVAVLIPHPVATFV